MRREFSKFHRLLKQINRIALEAHGGELPPDVVQYARTVDKFTETLLPAPSSPQFLKAHGKLTVYSLLLEQALDEVNRFEKGKN